MLVEAPFVAVVSAEVVLSYVQEEFPMEEEIAVHKLALQVSTSSPLTTHGKLR